MKILFHDDLIAPGHAFDTTRKPGWIADSLRQHPVKEVRVVRARPANDDRLRRVHSADYVQAVRDGKPKCLAESQGFPWDFGVYRAAAASAGAASDAARAALEDGIAGALSTGLHHAAHETGAGFCTFNGLALAALRHWTPAHPQCSCSISTRTAAEVPTPSSIQYPTSGKSTYPSRRSTVMPRRLATRSTL